MTALTVEQAGNLSLELERLLAPNSDGHTPHSYTELGEWLEDNGAAILAQLRVNSAATPCPNAEARELVEELDSMLAGPWTFSHAQNTSVLVVGIEEEAIIKRAIAALRGVVHSRPDEGLADELQKWVDADESGGRKLVDSFLIDRIMAALKERI